MQKPFTIITLLIQDCQSLAVQLLHEGYASSPLWFHAFENRVLYTIWSTTLTTIIIHQRNLVENGTQRQSSIPWLTPLLTSKRHRTMYNHTSIERSHILNDDHVGDVVAAAVAASAGDGLAAAGDGRPTQRQNSWESHTSFNNSNNVANTNKWIAGLLYQLLCNRIKAVLIKAAMIVARLCHRWVYTSAVDPVAVCAAHIVDHLGLNLWRGRMTIRQGTMKYICEFRTYVVLHVLYQALAGPDTSPSSRPKDNGGRPLRWGRSMSV